jgi:hypothetical protein
VGRGGEGFEPAEHEHEGDGLDSVHGGLAHELEGDDGCVEGGAVDGAHEHLQSEREEEAGGVEGGGAPRRGCL